MRVFSKCCRHCKFGGDIFMRIQNSLSLKGAALSTLRLS